MEGTAAHPIPARPDSEMSGDLPGSNRLLARFKYIQLNPPEHKTSAGHSQKENGKRRLVRFLFSFGYGKGAACLPRLGGWCSVVIPYSGWTMCLEVGRLLLCLSPSFLLPFLASGVPFRLGHTHDLYNTFRPLQIGNGKNPLFIIHQWQI